MPFAPLDILSKGRMEEDFLAEQRERWICTPPPPSNGAAEAKNPYVEELPGIVMPGIPCFQVFRNTGTCSITLPRKLAAAGTLANHQFLPHASCPIFPGPEKTVL